MKILIAILLVSNGLCLSVGSVSAAESVAGPDTIQITPPVLSVLFATARTNNPSLRTAEARIAASLAAVETVRAWDDPRATIGGLIGPARRMPSQDGDLLYGIEQNLPLWDRPRLNRSLRLSEAQMQTSDAALQEAQVRRDLAKALLRLAFSHRTTRFLTNDIVWLDALTALQEERFRAGFGSHTDLLQLQNERSRRLDDVRTEQSRRRLEEAALNRLLGRDLTMTWPEVELPRLAPPVAFSTNLAHYAAANDPRTKVFRSARAAAVAATRLTETMRRPDVSVGLQARQYSGDAGIREGMLSVSFSLPWWNAPKYRADLQRDEAKVRTVEAELAEYEISVREEVLRFTLATDTAHREALLYRDEILQRTQQAVASHQAMWESNRGPLREVLDGRRAFFEGQLAHDRAITEQHLAFADLAALCDLPDYLQLPRLLAEFAKPAVHSHPVVPASK
jgi:outer membrane protein TolC